MGTSWLYVVSDVCVPRVQSDGMEEFMGKKLTKTQAVNLFNGKTITLSGLSSKAGNEFDAKGKLTGGKIELIFDKGGKK